MTAPNIPTAHALTGERLAIPLAALRPHPRNTRKNVTPESVAGLAENIRARGLLSPLIVRDVGMETYELLAGHRRAVALKAIGAEYAPCLVVSVDDDEALRIVLAENADREAPELFAESDAVEALMAREGWKVADVAQHLGKPKAWVALRHAVANVHPKIRKDYEKHADRWTPAMMELLSHVARDGQETFLTEHPYALNSEEQMERAVSGWLRTLDRAPWDLDDGTLVAKAGTCRACPKQSANARDLFGLADDKVLEPKQTRCLDGKCWALKMVAHVKREAAKHAKDSGGKPLLYVAGPWDDGVENVKQERILGEPGSDPKTTPRVLPAGTYEIVKANADRAEPALVVSGRGQGSLIHVRLADGRATGKGGKAKAAKDAKAKDAERVEPSLEEREAKHVRNVRARVLEILRDRLAMPESDANPFPPAWVTLALLPVYGVRMFGLGSEGTRIAALRDVHASKSGSSEAAASDVWAKCVEEVIRALTPFRATDTDRCYEEGERLAELLSLDWLAMNEQAMKDVPAPASLEKARKRVLDAAPVEKPAKKAKGSTTKKAKK